MRIYLDSNVFISFVREEIDGAFNLWYIEANNFFQYCVTNGTEVVVSQLFFEEVENIISLNKEAVKEILDDFPLKWEELNLIAAKESIRISHKTRIHVADAWHVACAVENKCDYIITFNLKDFMKTQQIIPCYSPTAFQ